MFTSPASIAAMFTVAGRGMGHRGWVNSSYNRLHFFMQRVINLYTARALDAFRTKQTDHRNSLRSMPNNDFNKGGR
jgi:hypothetical protein